jgi:probable HAF family extracellular repeat protein
MDRIGARSQGPLGWWRALALAVAFGQPSLALSDDQYTVVELGKLWADSSRATGINDTGQVVGTLYGSTGFLLHTPKMHAFLYSDGELNDLHESVAKIKNCRDTTGEFITGNGEVVGEVFCSLHERVRSHLSSTWFVYRKGVAVVVQGAIGASSKTGEFPVAVGRDWILHIFRLDENGTMHDNGLLAVASGIATGIPTGMNSAGQVVGVRGGVMGGAWTWLEGTVWELAPGAGYSSAWAINAAGDVVGTRGTSMEDHHAFLYRIGSMRDLGTLGGHTSVALAINTKGQIVGFSDITEIMREPAGGTGARAFLYEDGKMKDLTRLLVGPDAPFVTLRDATAINDVGMITANGTDSRSTGEHAYLLKPVR